LPVLVHLLPLLHLWACVYIQVEKVETGWEQLIKIDFPFSVFLVALTFRSDRPLLWFGTLGTLWWYFLSWAGWRLFRVVRPPRAGD
jgi:hypothetical protein